MRKMASALHFRVRLIFIGLTKSDHFGRQRFDVGAANQQVEHERHLTKENWLQITEQRVVVFAKEQRGAAQPDPAKAVDHQPNTDEARNKSRAVNEQA